MSRPDGPTGAPTTLAEFDREQAHEVLGVPEPDPLTDVPATAGVVSGTLGRAETDDAVARARVRLALALLWSRHAATRTARAVRTRSAGLGVVALGGGLLTVLALRRRRH
ncbi:hypothetical protein GCM10009665_51800 [Kitasatospora nipponensis]|uniref:MYXO-CTERM domain-containing protein n=1 Tax=Kitasatospora nipponensis TaxID=258049 RepID=A0ABN1WP92_9ACTN